MTHEHHSGYMHQDQLGDIQVNGVWKEMKGLFYTIKFQHLFTRIHPEYRPSHISLIQRSVTGSDYIVEMTEIPCLRFISDCTTVIII